MKNLETLIQELCPGGVEFVKLGDVCKISRGKVYSKKYLAEHIGEYPVYSSQTVNDGILGKIGTYDCNGKFLTWTTDGAYAGTVFYRQGKFSVTNVCGLISCSNPILSLKFLYYWLTIEAPKHVHQGMGNPKLMSNQMAKIEIPLPPIEVQTEIVRILDKFTSLEAELEAELDCRKRQYEYYRDKLLSFDKVGGQEVEWKKMGEVCKNICSGGTPLTSKPEYYDGNIPWLRTQEVDYCEIHSTLRNITQLGLENSSAKMIPANCVIVAMYGATAAKVAINKIPLCTNQACCNLEIDEKQALVRYVYQWICKQYEVLKAMGEGSQHNINAKKVKDFKIPIPSLEEQRRIVSILDRFESLTTSLQSGLPAEIAARRQQYEHYRDKLLTFKRKGAA